MKTKMVSYTFDTLPPRTEADHARIRAMSNIPDSEIDLTDPDAPELSDEHWATAPRGKFWRPIKAQVTAKLDRDVIAWLKSDGRGYQTRMNAILRREMLRAIGEGKKVA